MEDFLFRLAVAVIPFILLVVSVIAMTEAARMRRLRRRLSAGFVIACRPAGRHFVRFP